MSLPWTPRLIHGSTTADLSLPQRPWVPEPIGVGGYEESAAGIGSAWEYRRDEPLRLRLRAWEWEWPAVRDWIAAGQRAQPVEINLCQVGPSTPVRLVSPRMGEPAVPTLTETSGVWEIEVVVRSVSGASLYEPYYDEQCGVNLIINPGFEAAGAYWGAANAQRAYLSDSAKAHSGTGYLQVTTVAGVQHATSPSDLPTGGGTSRRISVSPGDVVDFGCWAYRETGNDQLRARLWLFDGAGNNLPGGDIGANSVTAAAWQLSQRSYTIPAGAGAVRLDLQAFGGTTATTARFDDAYLRIRRVR